MENPVLKKFAERYGKIVDDEKGFLEFLCKPLQKAFRVNTIKADKKQVLEKFSEYGIQANSVGWHPEAFTTDFFEIGNTIEHFMGYIYIQELTSMMPAVVLSESLSGNRTILDCCAAPGSKTTQIASMMGNKGCIIANDIDYVRIKALKFNIEKLGVLNTIITNQDFRFFSIPEKFDAVLLDAPCTSEGTIRKDRNILSHWSEKKIFGLSRLQKQMILKGFDLLRDGGSMVYSTCTFAPEENEEVVQYLLDNRKGVKIEKIKLKGFKLSEGILKWNKKEFAKEIENCSRVWPHHNDTDGFFMAKIRKA